MPRETCLKKRENCFYTPGVRVCVVQVSFCTVKGRTKARITSISRNMLSFP